jgi:hypothetical protein
MLARFASYEPFKYTALIALFSFDFYSVLPAPKQKYVDLSDKPDNEEKKNDEARRLAATTR